MKDGFGVNVGPEPREGPEDVQHLLEGHEGPVDVTHYVFCQDFLLNTIDIKVKPGDHGVDDLVLSFDAEVPITQKKYQLHVMKLRDGARLLRTRRQLAEFVCYIG